MVAKSFFFSPPAAGKFPYLYFAGKASETSFSIQVDLDDVFVAEPSTLPISQPPFKLETGTSPFTYQVVVPEEASLFSPTEPLRTSLCQAFDSFLDELDAASLKPGRLRLVRALLAQTMPLTFAETLYFRYGLDPAARQIDLSPEMRLRIDFQTRQAVDPHESLLNGFVGAGTSYVQLGELTGGPEGTQPSSSAATLTFDRFLALQQGMSVTSSPGGGGGVVDLQGAATQMPHWRLVYPRTYPGSAELGQAVLQSNPALLGAPTRAALAKATQAYADGGAIESPAVAVFFRGRAAVVPEIPVYLWGQLNYVAVGTTIRDLLSVLSPLPRIKGASVHHLGSQAYSRVDNRIGVDGNKLAWGISLRLLELESASGGSGGYQWYGEALDSFDLPVLSGDLCSVELHPS